MLKRILDLGIIFVFSPILLLFFILSAFAIFLFDGTPIFFSQDRGGFKGKVFKIYKFRTMKIENKTVNSSETERISSIGKLLRKTSLDELPSIFNIIKGEMSLVGPRPLISDYLNLYNDFQKQRHNVRPGMTGLAQVKGRNRLKWNERFELDVWYVNNQNIFLDLKIIFLTFLRIFDTENIQHKDEITMYKFTGNDED